MEIGITSNPSRRATYIRTQSQIVQAEKKADASATTRIQDEITISPEARAAMQKEGIG